MIINRTHLIPLYEEFPASVPYSFLRRARFVFWLGVFDPSPCEDLPDFTGKRRTLKEANYFTASKKS